MPLLLDVPTTYNGGGHTANEPGNLTSQVLIQLLGPSGHQTAPRRNTPFAVCWLLPLAAPRRPGAGGVLSSQTRLPRIGRGRRVELRETVSPPDHQSTQVCATQRAAKARP